MRLEPVLVAKWWYAMNRRIAFILKDLAHSVDTLSLLELSKRYGVSERTIRNDITQLNTMLRQAGIGELTFDLGGAIVLPPDFSHAQKALHVSDTVSYRLSSEERAVFGAALLIASRDYLTTNELAKIFSVSRTTVLNDLSDIKQTVITAGLQVESKAGKGMRAIGPESARRLFLVDLLVRRDPVSSLWLSSAEKLQIQKATRLAQKVLEEASQKFGISLPDMNYQTAVCVLFITIIRVENGVSLDGLEDEFLGCSREFVGPYEHEIMSLMAQQCNVSLSSDDELFFTAVAQTFRYHNKSAIKVDKANVTQIAQNFIRGVSQRLEVGLEGDMELLGQLSNYFGMIFVSAEPLKADDPIAGGIAQNQSWILEAVQSELTFVEPIIGRPLGDDEAAGITLCFCAAIERWKVVRGYPRVVVVCSGGDTTAHLMAEQLRRRFGVRVVKLLRVHEAKSIDTTSADLVVSTTPLTNCKIPLAVVHPVLDERDLALIAQKLDEMGIGWSITAASQKHVVGQGQSNHHDDGEALLNELMPVIEQRVGASDPLLEKVRTIVLQHFS